MVAHSSMSGQFVGFDGQLYPHTALDAFGPRDCRAFRQRILSRCGALANAMRAEYLFLAKQQSHVKANLRFLELDAYLNINNFHLLCSHDELTEFGDSRAELCATNEKLCVWVEPEQMNFNSDGGGKTTLSLFRRWLKESNSDLIKTAVMVPFNLKNFDAKIGTSFQAEKKVLTAENNEEFASDMNLQRFLMWVEGCEAYGK